MKYSVVTRIGLSPREMQQVRKISEQTGITVSRLIADAVREKLLQKAAA